MPHNVIDIAKKIVCKTDAEHGDTISNLKLQKLLYYMQGFHLAFFDAPLFNECVEAWMYGPVVPVAFHEFKKYGNRAINPANYTDELELTDEQQQLFDTVYLQYNRYSASALMKMTHTEGPWKRHNIGEVITNEELRSFFLTQIHKEKDGNESFLTDEFGRIMLTDAMKESLQKAEGSLAEGNCMTEEKFQTRFAQWSRNSCFSCFSM